MPSGGIFVPITLNWGEIPEVKDQQNVASFVDKFIGSFFVFKLIKCDVIFQSYERFKKPTCIVGSYFETLHPDAVYVLPVHVMPAATAHSAWLLSAFTSVTHALVWRYLRSAPPGNFLMLLLLLSLTSSGFSYRNGIFSPKWRVFVFFVGGGDKC